MTNSEASNFDNWDTLQQDPGFIKQLAAALVEEGLLTQFQVDVAIYDQDHSGKRFAEVLQLRGWLQTEDLNGLAQRVANDYRQTNPDRAGQAGDQPKAADQQKSSKREFFEQETVVVNRADFDLD
ncbi:MAG: hypothetical protein AAGF24_01730 [Cyanobacteria bacterium P01_H01_bin.121]